jgi:hypothetical protein
VSIGYATGLLVLCELACSAATLSRAGTVEIAVVRRRGLGLGAAAVLAATSSTLTLVGGSIHVGATVLAATFGVLGAMGLLALATANLRR